MVWPLTLDSAQASAVDVDAALTPGTYQPNQCGTDTNFQNFCLDGPHACPERDTNNGRPDVFANKSRGAGEAFAIGLTPLDDVFRVHGWARRVLVASRSTPRA